MAGVVLRLPAPLIGHTDAVSQFLCSKRVDQTAWVVFRLPLIGHTDAVLFVPDANGSHGEHEPSHTHSHLRSLQLRMSV